MGEIAVVAEAVAVVVDMGGAVVVGQDVSRSAGRIATGENPAKQRRHAEITETGAY